MTSKNIPTVLRERNEQEFVEVTRRIQDALLVLQNDPKIKATQNVLAKLADCSRGTLNNRKWPLEQLQTIKEARKAHVTLNSDTPATADKDEARIDRYKEQLFNSREEVLYWKNKHDKAIAELSQANDLTKLLQGKLASSEQEISRLRKTIDAKVVQIPAKQPK